ncbi:hypothetical protein EXU30_09255 [Shewanella maritima]|uniref:Leucine-rich repeat domain-containing protein n=1 Tax=Shewanella maritima TaxID=2520507 RepID=A0A411PH06_9GAMM|nr:hypothetical protein [Shewanella maritima]QBF82861.1 hypothetical protein EXU30_09255 [Shewanella maritima]
MAVKIKFSCYLGDIDFYQVSPSNIDLSLSFLNKQGSKIGVYLNFSEHKFKSIDFLKEVKNLTGIKIYGIPTCSTEILGELNDLKSLTMVNIKKSNISFDHLDNIIELNTDWYPWLAKEVIKLEKLQVLSIHKFNSNVGNLSSLTFCKDLRQLIIVGGNLNNLEGLEKFQKLKKLELSLLRNLTHLSGLQHLNSLESLELYGLKKVMDISPVFNLTSLKHLNIYKMGDISSINGIANLVNLIHLHTYDLKISDLNLEPILSLEKVISFKLQNKKGYSHKEQEVKDVLYSKSESPYR